MVDFTTTKPAAEATAEASQEDKNPNFNSKRVIWNIINCLLASSMVTLGALTSGHFTAESLILAIVVGISAFVAQFKDFWKTEEDYYDHIALFKLF